MKVIAFFAIYLMIGVFIYDDYGVSWDEFYNLEKGERSYDYLTGKIESLDKYHRNHYGVAFELPLYALQVALGLEDTRDILLMRHLCNFLFFYTSTIFFYLLLKNRFKSRNTALLGTAMVILSPRIFAHSFYNSKDLGFMSAFMISMYTLNRYLQKKTLKNAAAHSITTAFAINIRMAGMIIPAVSVLLIAIDAITNRKKEGIKMIMATIAAYTILAAAFTTLFWPYLWTNPVENFIKAFQIQSRYDFDNIRTQPLYMGQVYPRSVPWHYVPVWMGVTTPPLYILGFMAHALWIFIRTCRSAIRTFRAAFKAKFEVVAPEMTLLMSWMYFIGSIVAVIIFDSFIANGWRQMFFIYPSFIVLSVDGISSTNNAIKGSKCRIKKHMKWLLYAIVVGCLLSTAYTMVRYHPHQMVYFNILTGLESEYAFGNFELDYWGVTSRSALEFILENNNQSTIRVHMHPGHFRRNRAILEPDDRDRLRHVPIGRADYVIIHYHKFRDSDDDYAIYYGKTKILGIYVK